jgi:hypothetical protein
MSNDNSKRKTAGQHVAMGLMLGAAVALSGADEATLQSFGTLCYDAADDTDEVMDIVAVGLRAAAKFAARTPDLFANFPGLQNALKEWEQLAGDASDDEHPTPETEHLASLQLVPEAPDPTT